MISRITCALGLLTLLVLSPIAQAGTITYFFLFDDSDGNNIYDVFATATGADQNGMASYGFQINNLADSSLPSFANDLSMFGLDVGFTPYGMQSPSQGPSGPSIWSAGAVQPLANPGAVFGMGFVPVNLALGGASDINTAVPMFLGQLDMGGQLLVAEDITLGGALYDLSQTDTGFLSESNTTRSITTLDCDPNHPDCCPEPASIALMGVALVALVGGRRRR